MATVIEFSTRRIERKTEGTNFGPAQIVIFTGVRIERLLDSAIDTPKRQTRLQHRSNQATAEELE
jgi:hypothetical protein